MGAYSLGGRLALPSFIIIIIIIIIMIMIMIIIIIIIIIVCVCVYVRACVCFNNGSLNNWFMYLLIIIIVFKYFSVFLQTFLK